MDEEKDSKIYALLCAIAIYDRPDVGSELPWSAFKSSDLAAALLDIAIGRLEEWSTKLPEIVATAKVSAPLWVATYDRCLIDRYTDRLHLCVLRLSL